MGIDIDGKMLIGCWGDDVEADDLHAWAEENDSQVSICSPHYDAGPEECFYGFEVESVASDELSYEWLLELKDKAERFKELAGCKTVILIGMQNVW